MIIRYTPAFITTVKKLDVRIRNSLKKKILLFTKDSSNINLNSHSLRKPYVGSKSINITSDWRAVYQEKNEDGEEVALFIAIGTHEQLYKKRSNDS